LQDKGNKTILDLRFFTHTILLTIHDSSVQVCDATEA